MPKNAARKTSVRQRQRATGEPYNVARRHDEETGLPFDPSWVHLEVSRCPMCRGENIEWLMRGSDAPQPGEPTDFIRPTDPGWCFDCWAHGQSSDPDHWGLTNGLEPDHCPYCGEAPVGERHLPWNDGKHYRVTGGDDKLVPADGRWYRYQCPEEHWWISSPRLVTLEGPTED